MLHHSSFIIYDDIDNSGASQHRPITSCFNPQFRNPATDHHSLVSAVSVGESVSSYNITGVYS